ncbi:MAG: hypothetical protein U0441_31360 [Polyangiaceae bacterium]
MASRARVFALLAFVALAGVSCNNAPPLDPSQRNAVAIAAIDVRIRGTWVLTAYTPETPLEPVLAAMLGFSVGNMVITFDGQRASTNSAGVQATRGYKVIGAQGDQFQIVLLDDQNVAYQAAGLFVGDDEIRFRSYTMPWQGSGSLKRQGAAPTPSVMPLPPPPPPAPW